MNNSVSLVIPVFNNESTLKRYLVECYELLHKEKIKFEILLCDDGSSDNSLLIMQRFKKNHKNVSIIIHKKNKGIAATLKDLYSQAHNEYIVLFSADGGWRSLDTLRLIRFALKTNGDIVIGKRTHKKYTLKRKAISFTYNMLPLIMFGKNLFDVGSVKIFKSKIFKQIKTKSKSVFFEAEFLIKAANLGYNIKAISVHHKRNKRNKSGVNSKIVLDSFLDALRFRLDL